MSTYYDECIEDECIAFAANMLRMIDDPSGELDIKSPDLERMRIVSRYLSSDAREKLELYVEDN